MRWVLFSGRFQPFHNSHLQTAKEWIKENYRVGDVFVLAAVTETVGHCTKYDREYVKQANEHYRANRTPWPIYIRLQALEAVVKTLRSEFPGVVITATAIPRPELSMSTVRKWFPGDRLWIIPLPMEQDHFDEQKLKFWYRHQESVQGMPEERNLSGKELRELWAEGNIDLAGSYMPSCVRDIYLSWETARMQVPHEVALVARCRGNGRRRNSSHRHPRTSRACRRKLYGVVPKDTYHKTRQGRCAR